jgi:hypothetical protein
MFRSDRKARLVLAVALLIAFGTAIAQQTAPPSGSWSGVLRSDNHARVRVDAQFSSNGVSLHFADPFSCRIDAGFVENSSDGIYYAFHPSANGGAFCDKLYPGELVLSPLTNAGLPLSLNNGTARWSGTLNATSASP